LVVTERDWCDFVSYNEIVGEHLIVRVGPDDYTDKVRDALDCFLDLMEKVRGQLNLAAPTGRHPPVDLPAALAQ
jgi:hypothetical protein